MRIKNIVRNSFFSLLSQFALIIVGFFCQRTLNLRMGEELVGLNSTISNVINILAVSELGVSSAIIFHLYRVLADGDEREIAAYMNLYRRAYQIFALILTVLGLAVMPFIHLFIRTGTFSAGYIRIIYVLWLARTVLSYLMTYKRSILVADQKEYVVSLVTMAINVLNYSAVIIIVELTGEYVPALALNIVIEAALNLWNIGYINKRYPYLKTYERRPLEKNIFNKVFEDVKNIFVSRLAFKMLASTDSLIITSFISVATAGLYSNYCLITQSLLNITNALSGSIQPTMGNLFVENKKENDCAAVRQVTFVFFLISAVACCGVVMLIDPFITEIWLTKRYRLPGLVVILCVVNMYLYMIDLPIAMAMTVGGLFEQEKKLTLCAAVVNIILSVVLAKPLGLAGVQIGTCVAYLIQIVARSYYFFRDHLKKKMFLYLGDLLQYTVLAAAETALAYDIAIRTGYGGIAGFLITGILCVGAVMGVNLLIYVCNWRVKSLKSYVYNILKRQ